MLRAIFCFSDGSKRVLCDAGEFAPAEAGLTVEEWAEVAAACYIPPVIEVPAKVSRFQARAALLLSGKLPAVEALMASADTPALAKLAWTDAQDFERNSPTIASMATALGLSAGEVDQLFIDAGTIRA